MADDQSTFHAEVRVGRGLRPVTQHGRLEITSDRLRLEHRDGRSIAEASLDRVSARRLRWGAVGLALVVDGVKYNLDVPRVKWLGQTVRDSKHMADEVIAFIATQRGNDT